MSRALADIDDGKPIRASARDNDIPTSTLRSHFYGTTLARKRGKKGILTETEEMQWFNLSSVCRTTDSH